MVFDVSSIDSSVMWDVFYTGGRSDRRQFFANAHGGDIHRPGEVSQAERTRQSDQVRCLARADRPAGREVHPVRYWSRALIGLGLVTAGLAIENRAVFKLSLIGTCASGGPYVSARPCPPGTGTTILSIFLALVIAGVGMGLFAARGGGMSKGLATLGLGTMAWSLGFLTNGVTMLIAAYGPAASTGPGSKTGAIIVAATFIPLGLGPLLLLPLRRLGRSKTEALEEKGKRAPGVVTAVRDTGVTINENPRVHVDVRVEPPGEEPFQVTHTATISRVSLPRAGDRVTVIYDPATTQGRGAIRDAAAGGAVHAARHAGNVEPGCAPAARGGRRA